MHWRLGPGDGTGDRGLAGESRTADHEHHAPAPHESALGGPHAAAAEALDFSLRYTGTFNDDGETISEAWEI
jgi:hypothetical protein